LYSEFEPNIKLINISIKSGLLLSVFIIWK